MPDVTPAKPLLSGLAATIVGVIGTIAAAVSPLLPAPWGTGIAIGGFLCASLAGLSAQPPQFAAGQPLVQGTVATVLGGALGVLSQFYASIPPSFQPIALAVGAILAWLTGSALPALGSPSKAQLDAAVAAGDAAGAKVSSKASALEVLK